MVKSIKYQPADAILDFSRASVKNVFNRLGVLEEVGVDSPAYSHNPGKTNTSSDSFDLDALTFLQTVTINQDSSNNFSVGDTITVTNSNNLFDYFHAKIESISTDTLTVEVQGVYGTGEFSSWFLIESEGLIVEEESENLFQHSEDLTDSFWNKSNTTITANAVDAPDGFKTADKLVEDGTNNNHGISTDLGFNFVSGATYTQSWFVKPDERTEIQLSWRSDHFPPDSEVIFDLSNETVTENTNSSGRLEKLKDGYYRISATATSDSTGSSPNDVFLFLLNGGTQTYTGDGSSGLYVWGGQLEESNGRTSYIKTTNSTVVREEDLVNHLSPSKWFTPNGFTIFASFENFSTVTNFGYVWALSDSENVAGDYFGLVIREGIHLAIRSVFDLDIIQFNNVDFSSPLKVVVTGDENGDFKLTLNGQTQTATGTALDDRFNFFKLSRAGGLVSASNAVREIFALPYVISQSSAEQMTQ